jgi:Tfp pilus assembly protein PilO
VPTLNRLKWHWSLNWGWPGAAGVALLLLTLVGGWRMQAKLDQEEQDLLRAKVAQLSALQRLQASSPEQRANQRDPRDEARDALPDLKQRGALVRKVLQQAEAGGLTIGRVDYAVQPEEPGLQRLRMTMPISGNYTQLRRFIARVLNQMPQTALDGLQLDRPADQPEVLTATIRLSIFFRGEPR